jgi:hypothetical protein
LNARDSAVDPPLVAAERALLLLALEAVATGATALPSLIGGGALATAATVFVASFTVCGVALLALPLSSSHLIERKL